jgi:three-Cys-motif partner protein
MSADVADDGLICNEAGAWTEDKLRHVSLYSTLFSSGMKGKWNKRVYVDLYAGAGHTKIRDTSRIILGSPLLALGMKDPFDKYVFCEEDPRKIAALRVRVGRAAPNADVTYITGNCNALTEQILTAIPAGSRGDTVLTLCFGDPYDIGLKFATLRALSVRYVDFMLLLAVWMDANRAYRRYVQEDATKVDEFLGSDTWRERWSKAQWDGALFPQFLATEFASAMQTSNYLPTPLHRMKRVKSDEKNLPLYYIALFSRNDLGHKYWDQVLKYGTDQQELF